MSGELSYDLMTRPRFDELCAELRRLRAENQTVHQFYKRSCERYDELVAEVNKLHATAIAATKAAYVAGGVKSPN